MVSVGTEFSGATVIGERLAPDESFQEEAWGVFFIVDGSVAEKPHRCRFSRETNWNNNHNSPLAGKSPGPIEDILSDSTKSGSDGLLRS